LRTAGLRGGEKMRAGRQRRDDMRHTKSIILALVGALFFLLFFTAVSASVLAAPSMYTTNTSTSVGNAVDNAVRLSARAFPSGAPVAVVTSSTDSAGAMAAGVLARVYDGALLLARSVRGYSDGDQRTRPLAAICRVCRRLPSAVSAQIAGALSGLIPPPQVVTITGANAYETAVLVARQIKAKLGTIERVMIVPADNPRPGSPAWPWRQGEVGPSC